MTTVHGRVMPPHPAGGGEQAAASMIATASRSPAVRIPQVGVIIDCRSKRSGSMIPVARARIAWNLEKNES